MKKELAQLYEEDYYLWIKKNVELVQEYGKETLYEIQEDNLKEAIRYYISFTRRSLYRRLVELTRYRFMQKREKDEYYRWFYLKSKDRLMEYVRVNKWFLNNFLRWSNAYEKLKEEVYEDIEIELLNEPSEKDKKEIESLLKTEFLHILREILASYESEILTLYEFALKSLRSLKANIDMEIIEWLADIIENITLIKEGVFPDRWRELWEEVNKNRTHIEIQLKYAPSIREEMENTLMSLATEKARYELKTYLRLEPDSFSLEDLFEISILDLMPPENKIKPVP